MTQIGTLKFLQGFYNAKDYCEPPFLSWGKVQLRAWNTSIEDCMD